MINFNMNLLNFSRYAVEISIIVQLKIGLVYMINELTLN
jgi:hypothetical protein